MVSQEKGKATNAIDRRIRKREQDRLCQRQARERTRNRIARLEQLVEELSSQDQDGQVADLMARLDSANKERDDLRRTLQTIQSMLTSQLAPKPSSSLAETPGSDKQEKEQDHQQNITQSQALQMSWPLEPLVVFDAGILGTDPLLGNLANTEESVLQPEQSSHMTPESGANVQSPDKLCECRSDSMVPTKKLNLWLFAEDTLSQVAPVAPQINKFEEAVADDTPIRALVEGWDAVEARLGGPLPPSWKKLREIDKLIFSSCDVVERLAVMRTMQVLIRYHMEPSQLNFGRLPPWYYKRPSQAMSPMCAIEYFPWPGIRERFVYHYHRYCSNYFWKLLTSGLRVLWPFEFRDCYLYNKQMDQYMVSPAFAERISDISSWRAGPDFFNRWPEFRADIPTFNSIPETVPHKPQPAARGLLQLPAPEESEWQEDTQDAPPTAWSDLNNLSPLS